MNINQVFELSMVLDTDHFQKVLAMAYNKGGYLKELDDEYLDMSLAAKGITVVYRDSRYKKKVRLLIDTALVVDDMADTDKLLRKLDKRIGKYFDHKYRIDDFTLSGTNLIVDINVGTRTNVSDYYPIQRIDKIAPQSNYSLWTDK